MTLTVRTLGLVLAAASGAWQHRSSDGIPEVPADRAAPYAAYAITSSGHGYFDADAYAAKYPELAEAISKAGALGHFVQDGWRDNLTWLASEDVSDELLILSMSAPNASEIAVLKAAGATIALVLDQPSRAIEHQNAAGISVRDALMRAMKSLVMLEGVATETVVPLISGRDDDLATIVDGLAAIISATGLVGAKPWIEYFIRELGLASAPAAESNSRTTGDLDPDNVQTAIAGYLPVLVGKPIRSVDCPAGLLLIADENDEPATRPICMEGPARWLVSGPYAYLPAGRWRSTSVFSVAGNHQGCRFSIYLYQLTSLSALREHVFTLPEEGDFSMSLEFDVVDPAMPIENKFRLLEGLIGGQFRVHHVSFTRIS